MTQREAKQYINGFFDGKRAAASSILELMSDLRKDIKNGYKVDLVEEIEKRVLTLKGNNA